VEGRKVTGLRTDSRGVTGIYLTGQSNGDAGPALSARLVADASGRSSHLPDWLGSNGLSIPLERTVDARVRYATRAYHLEPDAVPSWRALFEIPHARDDTRGCFALHIENNLLLVALQGTAGDHPPTDSAGFELFMKSLDCDIAAVVAGLRPASKVYPYGHTTGRRRLTHRLKAWPDGLIALGDAVCTFNPLYAQGMTVAGQEALALRDLLRGPTRTDLRGFGLAFQRRVGQITTWPWLLSTLADRAWTESTPLVRAAHWYLSTCQDLALDDEPMFRDLARVTNMLAAPTILMRPRHLARILRPRTVRTTKPHHQT
jgi:2-polyprenyl-6-methoxyphenol hydroxylase-like FAD-dependent oxidoreductase